MRPMLSSISLIASLIAAPAFAQAPPAKPLSTVLNPADAAEKQHTSYVNLLEFSRDGTLLASASTREPMVKLWNARSGKLIKEFNVAPLALQAMTLAPDGKRIAISARDRNKEMVQIWDIASGSIVAETDVKFMVQELQYFTDGIYAWGSPDWAGNRKFNQVLVLSPSDGSVISRKEMEGAHGSLNDIDFTSDGQYALVAFHYGDKRHSVSLWQTGSGRLGLNLPLSDLRTVAVARDSATIAVGKDNGVDLITFDGKPIRSMGQGMTRDLTFSPNGVLLAGGDRKGNVAIYSVASGSAMPTASISGTDLTTLAFSPDSTLLAAGWTDGTLRVFNTSDGKLASLVQKKSAPAKKK
jgi:WD40 repeat protein